MIKTAVRKAVPPSARLRFHWWLLDTPGISQLWTSLDPAMHVARVTAATRLVMDGFPRSGNSYARAAFLHANGTRIPISTHGHSYRFVYLGVRRRLPVIVLLRDPRQVLKSALHFDPTVSPAMIVRGYSRYYSHVLPMVDHVLVAPFADLTADFGEIIRRCNTRFGTDFEIYRRTDVAEAAVAAHIDAGTRIAVSAERFDAVVPRPLRTRESASRTLEDLDGKATHALREAIDVHDEMLRRARRTK